MTSVPGKHSAGGTGSTWVGDAEGYDRWFDRPWGRYAFGIECAAVLDVAGDLTSAVVADIGCGTGRLLAVLERLADRVVGVDLDPTMLAVADRRVDSPLARGDGRELPLRSHTFDVVIASTVCEFSSEPDQMVSDLVRVTRPGGRVVVGSLDRRSLWGMSNRKQLDRPPWSTARFFSPAELRQMGSRHGTVSLTSALFAPGYLPLLGVYGPPLERVCRALAPRCGAFNVMSITTAT